VDGSLGCVRCWLLWCSPGVSDSPPPPLSTLKAPAGHPVTAELRTLSIDRGVRFGPPEKDDNFPPLRPRSRSAEPSLLLPVSYAPRAPCRSCALLSGAFEYVAFPLPFCSPVIVDARSAVTWRRWRAPPASGRLPDRYPAAAANCSYDRWSVTTGQDALGFEAALAPYRGNGPYPPRTGSSCDWAASRVRVFATFRYVGSAGWRCRSRRDCSPERDSFPSFHLSLGCAAT